MKAVGVDFTTYALLAIIQYVQWAKFEMLYFYKMIN